jgi:hypothetical protein
VPGGRAESCGNEYRAEPVAVQRGGGRLAAGPSLQDTGGRECSRSPLVPRESQTFPGEFRRFPDGWMPAWPRRCGRR